MSDILISRATPLRPQAYLYRLHCEEMGCSENQFLLLHQARVPIGMTKPAQSRLLKSWPVTYIILAFVERSFSAASEMQASVLLLKI